MGAGIAIAIAAIAILALCASAAVIGYQIWKSKGATTIGGGTALTPALTPALNPVNTPVITPAITPGTGTTAPQPPPQGGTWKRATNTWYTSYPDPGSEECIKYSGCKYAGVFAYGGKKSEDWVKANNIVAFFDMSTKDAGALKGKEIWLRKGSKQFKATVLDTCGDGDCGGCCSQNAKKGGGYLVDVEKNTCIRELGSTGACDGTIEWMPA